MTCYYQDALKHLASWGYVVIAPNEGQIGSGQELIDATGVAVWADGDPTNPFYDKLDTDSIAAAGHSQGAVGAINAARNALDGVIDSVLALSMPDQGWIDWYNTRICSWLDSCEPLEIPVDATDQLDVPIFFARGTGLQNEGCEVDDWFSDQTHVDWRPTNTSVPYLFATVKVDVPEENTDYMCDPPTDYWIPIPPWVIEFPHPVEQYPHGDLSNAVGYATAWLDYTLRDCFGYSPVAFTGAAPEISGNSHWNPPPASHHSVIMNNLPTCA